MKIVQKDLRMRGFAVSDDGEVVPLFTGELVREATLIPDFKTKGVFGCQFPLQPGRIDNFGFTEDTLTEIRTGLPGMIKFGINDVSCLRSYRA